MAAQDYKFEGWLGLDKDSASGKMVWKDFEPKTWEETDLDIQVTHSGVCGTDLHVLRSGWVSFHDSGVLFEQEKTDFFFFTRAHLIILFALAMKSWARWSELALRSKVTSN